MLNTWPLVGGRTDIRNTVEQFKTQMTQKLRQKGFEVDEMLKSLTHNQSKTGTRDSKQLLYEIDSIIEEMNDNLRAALNEAIRKNEYKKYELQKKIERNQVRFFENAQGFSFKKMEIGSEIEKII